ncbi:hypothetical protein [Planococcus alpniumensis]|uniref:hypothetical protein n=1 Tax=Planococcus alpniumensis TaxID=2708345 RepID=UPI001B8CA4FC|nr:hypothetical protein [Planococcus sp. MSAK28401]
MTQLFISVGLLGFIIMTHLLVSKWAQYFHEQHGNDPQQTRKGILMITLPLLAVLAIAALFLFQTSQ